MAVKGLDHVAVAVEKLDPALDVWCGLFGWENHGVEVVPDQQARVARLVKGPYAVELVEPQGPSSTVRKFLDKRGPGLHHLCFDVSGIEAMLAVLSGAGVRLVDQHPRVGAGGRRIAFVHPAATGGVLIELSEGGADPDRTADPDKPGTLAIDVTQGVRASDRLLSPAAVAELQGCPEELVRAAIASGKLPSQLVHGPSASGVVAQVVRRSDAIAWRRDR